MAAARCNHSAKAVDVAIIGGGVVGSAIAYFLALEPAFDGCVCVIERDPTYRGASTALSAGGVRQQFSIGGNIAMSLFGAEFMRSAGDRLAVDGRRPEIGFTEGGYLFLASAKGVGVLARNHRLQRDYGANVSYMERQALQQRFPWLNVDDIAAGCLGERGEGWLDPYALLQAFRAKARDLGVEYVQDEVMGMAHSGRRISALQLSSGGRLLTGNVVNAAGIRAARVAVMVGIDDLPVTPRKRCVFSFQAAELVPGAPLTVDPGGVYFRPEGDGFLCGVAPQPDPDCDDFDVQHELFETTIWPALAHRVPAFEALRPGAAWAGHYAFNVCDQNAVLGPHPDIVNLFFANGFSGHGLQQSPAVGRAIAELITFGQYRALDLSAFGFERFARGELVRELNVV